MASVTGLTYEQAQSKLDALKAQGKTESNSKSAGKLADYIKTLKPSNFGSEAVANAQKKLSTSTQPIGSNVTGGGIGMGMSGGSTGDFSNVGNSIQSAIAMQQQAIQPAVDTLETQKSTLATQYDKLLSDVLGREERYQSQELGARGITPSSSVGQQQMTRALNPLQQDVASAQSQDLQAINNAIAQMQAGAGQAGISTGLDITSLLSGLQQQEFAQNLAQQQQDLAQRQYNEITLPASKKTSTDPNTELLNFLSGGGLSSIFNGGAGNAGATPGAGSLESDFTSFEEPKETFGIDFDKIIANQSNKQQKFWQRN